MPPRAILAAHRRGELDAADVDEESLARYLYCPGVPDADLIVRTGGEHRLSNFLLWRGSGRCSGAPRPCGPILGARACWQRSEPIRKDLERNHV